jgi:plasmid stabilization system protein ParE
MQLQFSRRSSHDLDRLYTFLIKSEASLKTADKAITAIKEGAKLLLMNPEAGTALDDDTLRRELYIKFGKNGYTLRYFPDYEMKLIRVLRIWHNREDRDEY